MANNRDLLKEAIADAKAVKETAIANAKAALEESFGPFLREKLSQKISEMEETEEEMTIKAQKLMGLIQKRIPSNIIDSLKTNKIAQREVIAAFAELIGVPRNGLTGLVQGIKDLAKTNTQPQQAVAENRIVKTIKKKDIK
jgi:hypothetical protein